MPIVNSTYELLYKIEKNLPLSQDAVLWAIEMLEAGFDSEHLRILAGVYKPDSDFYVFDIIKKIFTELNLVFPNSNVVIKDYAFFLVNNSKNRSVDETLKAIYELYLDNNHDAILEKFAYLFWAKDELQYDTTQSYWEGANRENIDRLIINYFMKWQLENEPNLSDYLAQKD